MKKICFAFIAKSSINNEIVWYNYLKGINNIEILIHCKEKSEINFLNKLNAHVYINSVPNSWGHLQKLQNFLIERSKSLNCDKFIILSDSCLPIRNFNYLLNKLDNDKSYIDNCEAWDLSRFPNSNLNIKLMANQQWCILDRRHFDLFLNDETRIYFENYVILPEESYFSTVMEKNSCNNSENVISKRTTFVDWNRTRGDSPYYFEGTENDIEYLNIALKDENILFFRKVKNNPNSYLVNKINELIQN